MPTKAKVKAKKTVKKKLPLARSISQRFARLRAQRSRRVYKSFRMTRSRDIPKHAPLPGYVALTSRAFGVMRTFRRQFLVLLTLYVLTAMVLIGVSQQDQYRNLTGALDDIGPELAANGIDTATKTLGLFAATFAGSLNGSLSEIQQLYIAVVYLLVWLVTVWLLRQLLAGNAVKVRDGLYNASAPFISTLLIFLLMLVQALPAAMGVLVFAIATQNGILQGGVEAMAFGVGALLLMILSLYWLASSFFALIIVTLPGTYPMAAIRGASELALGRRSSLIFRLLWLTLILVILWAIIVIPVLFLDGWLNITWLPLVTIAVQVATGVSLLFGITYIFLLYRTMIDEPAK